MKIKQFGKEYEVTIHKSNYYDGNLAIFLTCKDGEPYGNLTVNLSERLLPDTAYVDTNNMPDAERFIKEYGLGEFTGTIRRSGFCDYPLYRFNLDKIEEV